MKFIKLEILNLASLDKQGGEVINFEEGALKESNIFSIVGPTGSGKSTILDAICLALYNRAPRYPRKSGERGKIAILGELNDAEKNRIAPTDGRNILTRGKKVGYSKLTFRANDGNFYRAEWHVRFKTKNYDDAETSLYKLTLQEGTKHEETAEWSSLPQIIGLDYDQFLRTVLIAQGSFADFLKQSDDQRFELLEKLIGCENLYTDIAKRIKEKEQQTKEAYQELNASNIAYAQHDLTPEELEKLNAEIEELNKQENSIKQQLEDINKDLNWFSQEDKYNENLQNYNKELQLCKDNLKLLDEKARRLKLHNDTVDAVAIYKDIQNKESSITAANTQLKNLENDQSIQDEELKKANDELKKREEEVKKHSEKYKNGKPHIDEARGLKRELNIDRQNLQKIHDDLEEAQSQLKKANDDVSQNEIAIDEAGKLHQSKITERDKLKKNISSEIQRLENAAKEAKDAYEPKKQELDNLDLNELQQKFNEATALENELKDAIRIQNELQNKLKQQEENKETVKTLNDRNTELKGLLATLNIEQLNNEVQALERTYTLMNSENWEMHRSNLKEGEKCPLCGATHHPYVSTTEFQKDQSTLGDLLKSKKTELDEQTANKDQWKGQQRENNATIEQIGKSTLANEISNLNVEWNTLSERHPQWPADEAQLTELQLSITKMKNDAEVDLNRYNKLKDDVDTLFKKKDVADNTLNEYKEKSEQEVWNAEQKVTDANTKLATEKGKTENLKRQQQEKENVKNNTSTALSDLQNKIEKKQLEMEKHVGKHDPDELEEKLRQRKDDAKQSVDDQKEVINQHNLKLNKIKGSISTTKEQINGFIEQKQASADKLDMWLKANASINREMIMEMYGATDDWNAYREEIKLRENALTSATTTHNNETAAHEKHQASKPASSKEELESKKAELDAWSNEELIGKKARLDNYQKAKKAMGELSNKLNSAKMLKDNWEQISKAIGSDGKDLRKIAQIYTLRFLVEHANAEIRKFNSRYELQQVQNSLGLRIIDHDRADDIRDITSLSGGETFIVSLGLALGLSSLSSNSISFENLFVDEGFGTLDPDTLASVIDSLAALQNSQGKKVGVISHTDTMSERITTQIRIVKNGNSGSSSIHIYPDTK